MEPRLYSGRAVHNVLRPALRLYSRLSSYEVDGPLRIIPALIN